MHYRRSTKLLAISVASIVVLAACGSDKKTSSTTPAGTTPAGTTPAGTTPAGTTPAGGTTPAAAGVSLKGDCPDNVVIQTDWMPEAEHGFLYQMVGEGYTIDKANATVTGPLIDATGADTGVTVTIKSGGGAQNFTPVTQLMYQDDKTLLGFVYTDEAIQ